MIRYRNIFRISNLKSINKLGLSDDYEVLHSIGKGSSSKVFQGIHVLTEQKVVIKIFKQAGRESIQNQINTNLKLLRLFNQLTQQKPLVKFIQFLDYIHDKNLNMYTMIYKFYHGVPLNLLIETISYEQALKSMFYLLHTVKFVHESGFIHRDMKPANILITKEGPRLFDFGLAKAISQKKQFDCNNFGTKCYKCPEVIYRMPKYDHRTDIWGLGLIFAEMLLNKRHILQYQNDYLMLSQIGSFCGLREQQRQNLLSQKLSEYVVISKNKSWQYLANKKNLNKQLIHLVKSMLEINPANRPSLAQILQNAIFKEVKIG